MIRITDHTLDLERTDDLVRDPVAALARLFEVCGLSWEDDPTTATVVSVNISVATVLPAKEPGWLIAVVALYEGTLQSYTVEVAP